MLDQEEESTAKEKKVGRHTYVAMWSSESYMKKFFKEVVKNNVFKNYIHQDGYYIKK